MDFRNVCLLLCLSSLRYVNSVKPDGPIVTTSYGQIEGTTVQLQQYDHTNTTIDTFQGIPYAQPPVGPLRLKKPEPPLPWTGVKQTKHDNTVCIQTSHKTSESEDCLYLDLYRPRVNNTSTLLPVMVYIHGGGFRSGSKNGGKGQYLAANGVILVRINYRLGPLGYLSTEDDSMPGNYGALDQISALQWVQQNIQAFGGDPASVTVFGESAGSASVSLLIFSPLAKGLFARAIMMSGVATTSRDVPPPRLAVTLKDVALTAGRQLGCTQNPGPDFLACLQTLDAPALYNASVNAARKDHSSGPFRPRVEATFGFMPDYPLRLVSRGEFNHINTIRGFNSQEQGGAVHDQDKDGLTREEFRTAARKQLSDYPYLDTDVYIPLMEQVYLGNTTDAFEIRSQTVAMLSDFTYILPTIREAKLSNIHSAGSKSFLYQFSYKYSKTHRPDWQAVTHGANVKFVFGLPPSNQSTATDLSVSQMMMSMWINFAKYGNPTPPGKTHQPLIHWQATSRSRLSYMDIDSVLQMKTYDSDQESSKLDLFERVVQEYLNNAIDIVDIVG